MVEKLAQAPELVEHGLSNFSAVMSMKDDVSGTIKQKLELRTVDSLRLPLKMRGFTSEAEGNHFSVCLFCLLATNN
ncbi:hypothetical protein C7B82_03675 [Stenomitos frigidus ULC18]|uniref:Uncharacterized protein n=1 Tax=Stenomitos frigidus ULC18 TaxID=2107698 RepID=A0A2T1ELP2_9CYAN|nr:hypothetical protein C7B82_03675 [Stenomitos frigidus ULC18]